MTIPDFQAIMLPLLNLAADDQERSLREVTEALAKHFSLTSDERQELLPSGRQTRFGNRVGWARTHLKKAGLLALTGHGAFRITGEGHKLLDHHPAAVTTKLLEQFPSYQEFRALSHDSGASKKLQPAIEAATQTPEEALEAGYQELRSALAEEILQRVKTVAPKFFEQLVVDLLVAMGYGGSRKDAGQAVGQSGDGGVDGVIKEDRLGLDVVYIQAKRWENTVGRPIVQGFAGSLEGYKARKGVLITTSKFSPEAQDYVNKIEKRIVLIDGEQLAQYMLDFGVGVTEVATYVVKRVEADYFEGVMD
jgi:restriction system protein